MSKIFISYARQDDPNGHLCQHIERHLTPHFEVWFDRGLLAGQKWWPEIQRRLEWCKGFICVLSPNWLNSLPCQKELDIALSLNEYIIPIMIHEVPSASLPVQLREIDYIDARDEITSDGFTCKAIAELIHAVYTTKTRPDRFARLSVTPGIEWCNIPEGRVTLSYNNVDEKTYVVPEFRISKSPITNAQFYSFIINHYKYRIWWHYSDNAFRWRLEHPEPSQTVEDDSPYVNVSWYDAVAFCNWLSYEMKLTISLPNLSSG